MNAVEDITALEHAFIAATSTEEVMAYMDPDHVRYDYAAPLQLQGAAALREAFDAFFTLCSAPKGQFLTLHVEASDELGVAHSIMHFAWQDAAGAPHEGTFRVTHVLRHHADGWKIFHSHVSLPLDPATGMARMDLRL